MKYFLILFVLMLTNNLLFSQGTHALVKTYETKNDYIIVNVPANIEVELVSIKDVKELKLEWEIVSPLKDKSFNYIVTSGNAPGFQYFANARQGIDIVQYKDINQHIFIKNKQVKMHTQTLKITAPQGVTIIVKEL